MSSSSRVFTSIQEDDIVKIIRGKMGNTLEEGLSLFGLHMGWAGPRYHEWIWAK